jgi:hypothetical protein
MPQGQQQDDQFNPGAAADAAVKNLLAPAETAREAMQRALAVMHANVRPWYSFLYHFALLLLRMFTLSVEVFLRRQFGERYLTISAILLGAWTFQLIAWLWNFAPSSLIPVYSLAFGFGSFGPSGGREPQAIFDLIGFCVVIYYMAAIWHLIAIFLRNREGLLWHSRSSGLSWPIWNWVNALGRKFHFQQDLVKMYMEPALCIAASGGMEKYTGQKTFLSAWLFLAGVALLLKGQVEWSERRKMLLDQLDSTIEAKELAAVIAGQTQPPKESGSSVLAAPTLRGQQKAAIESIIHNTPPELKKLLDESDL